MQVELKTIYPMRVAFIRHVGPYTEVGATWGRLSAWAGPRGLFGGVKVLMIGACWDDPEVTPPDEIRYDACITVGPNVDADGDVGIKMLGGGRYATAVHKGPYTELATTYNGVLGTWFASASEKPGDPPALEIYHNDPNSTAPEDLLTEVCIPVQE